MSLKSQPYYWLVCDGPNCKERCPNDAHDYTAWADESQAIDCAYDSDWLIAGEVDVPLWVGHLCENCRGTAICPECGDWRTAVGGPCTDTADCNWTPPEVTP